jgi:hypothetical protein
MKFVQYRTGMFAGLLQRQAVFVFDHFTEISNNLPGILSVWAKKTKSRSIYIKKVKVGRHLGTDPDLIKITISLDVTALSTLEEMVEVWGNENIIDFPEGCRGVIRFYGTEPNTEKCLADVAICITRNLENICVIDMLSKEVNESSVMSIQDICLFILYLYTDKNHSPGH